jgi:hypothetical protein
MFGPGTENEPRRSLRVNGKGAIGLLERDKFTGGHRLGCVNGPDGDCEPGNFMI